MITYINTDEVESVAKELSAATDELETEFNNLFKRFSNVPRGTKEWIGNQADYYFARVSEDKRHYTRVINELKSISRELTAEASSAKAYIKTNNT